MRLVLLRQKLITPFMRRPWGGPLLKTGREVPNLSMLQKIAQALGMKVKDLIPY